MSALRRLAAIGPLIVLVMTAFGGTGQAAVKKPTVAPPALAAQTPSNATQTPPGQAGAIGLSITPAIQDLALSPATTTASYSVQLYNHTNQTVSLRLSARDFTALNQTGGIAFLGENLDSKKDHGLSSILRLNTTSLDLAPNSGQVITATIDDVHQLARGGHYAAIVAQTATQDSSGQGNRVGINQAVSSLVFLETAGQGSKTVTLLPSHPNKLSFSLPDRVNLVFKATGNTQTVPRGIVTIGRDDTVRLRGQLNVDSGLILPGSTRLFSVPLSGNKHPWWPGTYSRTVSYQYDGSLGVTTASDTFFYVNIPALLITVLVLVVGCYALVILRRRWSVISPPLRTIVVRLRGSGRVVRTLLIRRPTVTVPPKPEPVAKEVVTVLVEQEPEEVDELTQLEPEAEREAESTSPETASVVEEKPRKVIVVTDEEATTPPSKTSKSKRDNNHKPKKATKKANSKK